MLPKQKEKRPYRLLYMSIGSFFLISGILSSFLLYNRTDSSQSNHLMERVNTIAEILSKEDILDLSASQKDLQKDSYNNLKNILINIRQVNTDTRFIYLIGQDESKKLFFYADSEDPNSVDYSPPGQSYQEASEYMYLIFQDGKSRSEGPSRDRWGIWFSGYAPIKNYDGKVIAMVGMDIPATEYLLNNIAFASLPILISFIVLFAMYFLRYAQSKEEKYLKMKEEFVSIASHEIRTPLVGIKWALEDIQQKDSSMDTDTRSTLDLIYTNCINLIRDTNDLLSINTPNEATKKGLNKENVKIKKFFEELKESLTLSALEHKVSINIEEKITDEDSIFTDKKNLRQIFTNLLGNAIKYSKPNTNIDIFYSKNEKLHIFKIKDQGQGIAEENTKKVFEGYFRTEKAIESKQVGTGIGLYLTKKMVKSMGGEIELESKINEGSVFTIKLPIN